jgi:hypothetical protein
MRWTQCLITTFKEVQLRIHDVLEGGFAEAGGDGDEAAFAGGGGEPVLVVVGLPLVFEGGLKKAREIQGHGDLLP